MRSTTFKDLFYTAALVFLFAFLSACAPRSGNADAADSAHTASTDSAVASSRGGGESVGDSSEAAPESPVASLPIESPPAAQAPVASPAPRAKDGGAASTPAPPETSSTEVDYTCTTDADCSVKNVGNCCGMFPACVNRDSATFPEQVKAQCSAQGRSSICGFQEIASCQCVEGRCAAKDVGRSGPELQ